MLPQGQQALFNVLKAYALHDIEVRQGSRCVTGGIVLRVKKF